MYSLTKLVDEASLVALSRMIWIDQQFSRLQSLIEAPERYRRLLRAQFTNSFFDEEVDGSHFLACGALSGEIYWIWRSSEVWRNILSTPERYGSGDRSFASWPTQIVSVSKSYVVDQWNAVLCLQKSLRGLPDHCHCHRFCHKLRLLFILLHYRQLDLRPVNFCSQFSPAQALYSWTFSSTKKLVDRTFLSVVITLTIFTRNGGSVGIYSVDPRKVWKWRSKFGKWTDTNCVGLQVVRCRLMKLSALLAKNNSGSRPVHCHRRCFSCRLVNTLFLCITGQLDWTLVDLAQNFFRHCRCVH